MFDFNRTPLTPASCKLVVYDRGTRRFNTRPALQHYRTYICYIPATRATRTSNRIKFFHKSCSFRTISAADRVSVILTDLLAVLHDPHPTVMFLQQVTDLNEAIHRLQTLLFLDQNNNNKKGRNNNNAAPWVKQGVERPRVQPTKETSVVSLPSSTQRTTRSQPARRHAIGTIIC